MDADHFYNLNYFIHISQAWNKNLVYDSMDQ